MNLKFKMTNQLNDRNQITGRIAEMTCENYNIVYTKWTFFVIMNTLKQKLDTQVRLHAETNDDFFSNTNSESNMFSHIQDSGKSFRIVGATGCSIGADGADENLNTSGFTKFSFTISSIGSSPLCIY
jgi:hypothetical protein